MKTVRERDAVALALMRIVVGVFLFLFGEYKVFGTAFTLHGGFQQILQGFLMKGAYPFAVPMLRWILNHAATPVAFLVAYGELSIGIALLVGVFSRLASVFGCLLMLMLWVSAGYPGPHAPLWIYFASSLSWTILALCFAALAVGEPEEIWSLRNLMPDRKPLANGERH